MRKIIPQEKLNSKKKWCRVHRTNLHDDLECLAQKNPDNKNKNPYKSKLNNIKNYNSFCLPLIINNSKNKILALIDTGSDLSYIQKSLCSQLNIKTQQCKKFSVNIANGQKIFIREYIEIKTSDNNQNSPIKIKLYIINGLDTHIIFGTDVLERLKIVINYKHKKINIFNKEYEMNNIEEKRPINFEDNNKTDVKNNMEIVKILENYKGNIKNKTAILNEKFEIKLSSKLTPNIKPYHVPLHMRKYLRNEIDELLQDEIIRPSSSHYGAPCFLKKKGENGFRLLIDYRALNKITIESQYYFPSLHENFYMFNGMKYFSKIDLKKGFYQIEILEKDKNKTAFSTPFGKYEFNRIPFGLINAPKTFHDIISRITKDVKGVMVFVDDLIIFSKTINEQLEILKTLLKIFLDKNVIINFDKCEFIKKEIKYLGFILNESGFTADTEKLQDFRNFKIPETRKQLQKLLGKINWYRPFIPKISIKLNYFYELLKGNSKKLTINPEKINEINNIYDEIKKSIILYYPDFNKKFYLYTDASDIGIGATFQQDGGVVGFYSKKFNEAQRKYSITEKEMFAIYKSINYWKSIIGGSKIEIYTDNKNLLGNKINFDKKVDRWKAIIGEYKLISGAKNIIADELSRIQKNNLFAICQKKMM